MSTTPTTKKKTRRNTASRPSTTKPDGPAAVAASLAAAPGATAAQLAEATRLGRSTVTKILARMAAGGTATRTPGGRTDSGQRLPDTWTATTSDGAAGEPTPVTPPTAATAARGDNPGTTTVAMPGAPTPGTAGPLGKGQLRAMVAEKLAAHPDAAYTPVELSHLLDGRSPGAISNALDKLVAEGRARQVKDKPRTFAHATPSGDQDDHTGTTGSA